MEWITWGSDIYNQYQTEIVFAVGVSALFGIYSIPFILGYRRERQDVVAPKRRGKMLRRERRKFVERMMLDAFVDETETQVYNEVISRAEAKEIYIKLKRVFNTHRDLFPSPHLLKDMIRQRMDSGVHAKVTLPKEDKPEVKKPRHMFDRAA